MNTLKSYGVSDLKLQEMTNISGGIPWIFIPSTEAWRRYVRGYKEYEQADDGCLCV